MASRQKAGALVERVRRRRRSPEQAQEEILGAAARLFLAHGPEQVSLVDVAREVGVSHALVSHYFGTFEALVETVVRRHVSGRLGALLERLLVPAPAPSQEDFPVARRLRGPSRRVQGQGLFQVGLRLEGAVEPHELEELRGGCVLAERQQPIAHHPQGLGVLRPQLHV